MSFLQAFCYVALTIILTSGAQVLLKWRILQVDASTFNTSKLHFYFQLLTNPWVIGALLMAFLAGLSWMAAMTRLPLNLAYPFISLTFPIVIMSSAFFFSEPIHWTQIVGTILIMIGLIFIQHVST